MDAETQSALGGEGDFVPVTQQIGSSCSSV